MPVAIAMRREQAAIAIHEVHVWVAVIWQLLASFKTLVEFEADLTMIELLHRLRLWARHFLIALRLHTHDYY